MQERRRWGKAFVVVALSSSLVACGASALRDGDSDSKAQTYQRWFDGPTRGDRAADAALQELVLAAWTEKAGVSDGRRPYEHLLDHPTGPARVVWAGAVADTVAASRRAARRHHANGVPGLDEGIEPGSDVWGFLRVHPDGTA